MKLNIENRMTVAALAMVFALAIPAARATNITIADGISSGGSGQGSEVGEVEPGDVNNHSWDLEAFAIKGNKLVLISGFDLLNGQSGFTSGDIFINTSGVLPIGTPLSGGNGNQNISGNMGYEYALDLNIAGGNFNVVDITAGSGVTLLSGYYRQNDKSNPFQYVSGGTVAYASQGLTLTSGLTTAQVQALYGADITTSGDNNYALVLDMSWWNTQFPNGNLLDTHFTIGCGNDVIVGEATGGFDRVPDAASTAMLLSLGLAGLHLLRRRVGVKA